MDDINFASGTIEAPGTAYASPSRPSIPGPNPPHGGDLVQLWVKPEEVEGLERSAERWPRLTLSRALLNDVEMLATGAMSPLRGFLGRDDFLSVVEDMRLSDGTVWPIPIVLPVDEAFARTVSRGQAIGLYNHNDQLIAVLDLKEVHTYDKSRYAEKVYGTTSLEHPGVARIMDQGDHLLAGPVRVLRRPSTVRFPRHHFDPVQTRRIFDEKGWKSVVAFQTRNPIHRAHEFIQKSALEIVDALLIHPLVGETKSDDIPVGIRMRCYESLIQSYYPLERTMLSVFPATMRYAGPREAVFHALVRKNYGCTHFIVGRDHAGVGNFYGTYDAQLIFGEFEPGELGITPMFFEHAFFCHGCEGMASLKTCPHEAGSRVFLSGTKVRDMIRRGEMPPSEFTRPEVARILIESAVAEERVR